MRLKNSVILFVTAMLFAAVGCSPAADISVVEAEMPVLNGLTSVHGEATVENAGGRDVMVENAVLVVHYKERELGKARLLMPIEIPAGGVTDVRYDFALDDVTLSSLQTIQSRIRMNPDAFTVDVDAWVRWGGLRRKIEMQGVSLVRIMEIITTFAS